MSRLNEPMPSFNTPLHRRAASAVSAVTLRCPPKSRSLLHAFARKKRADGTSDPVRDNPSCSTEHDTKCHCCIVANCRRRRPSLASPPPPPAQAWGRGGTHGDTAARNVLCPMAQAHVSVTNDRDCSTALLHPAASTNIRFLLQVARLSLSSSSASPSSSSGPAVVDGRAAAPPPPPPPPNSCCTTSPSSPPTLWSDVAPGARRLQQCRCCYCCCCWKRSAMPPLLPCASGLVFWWSAQRCTGSPLIRRANNHAATGATSGGGSGSGGGGGCSRQVGDAAMHGFTHGVITSIRLDVFRSLCFQFARSFVHYLRRRCFCRGSFCHCCCCRRRRWHCRHCCPP